MTPCDHESQTLKWPQYAPSAIYRKRLEIETPFQRPPIGNGLREIEWSRKRGEIPLWISGYTSMRELMPLSTMVVQRQWRRLAVFSADLVMQKYYYNMVYCSLIHSYDMVIVIIAFALSEYKLFLLEMFVLWCRQQKVHYWQDTTQLVSTLSTAEMFRRRHEHALYVLSSCVLCIFHV